MIINHNIPALNAVRMNQANNLALNKSIAKLSSGLKINSAADNAAGLAISEKMRAQIRGTEQAYQNSQDGISMLNTADGGMSGIHDILHRMRELSIQAAHDTMTDDDRQKIQLEIDSLRNEINSIATDTEFNTIKLLCAPEVNWAIPDGTTEIYVLNIDFLNNTITSTAIYDPPNSGALNNIMGVRLNGITNYDGSPVWANILVGASPEVNNANFTLGPVTSGQWSGSSNSSIDTFITWQFQMETSPGVFKLVDLSDVDSVTFFEMSYIVNEITVPTSLVIHVGANTNQELRLPLPVDMRTNSLGLTNGEPIVTSQSAANNSIMLVDNAITLVNTARAKVGSMQNRLEHTVENLTNYSINLSAAESRLRDLNISDQIKELTTQKVLLESSQAMIAQANNLSQNILTLLK